MRRVLSSANARLVAIAVIAVAVASVLGPSAPAARASATDCKSYAYDEDVPIAVEFRDGGPGVIGLV
jgi:uncharacterized membrane protein